MQAEGHYMTSLITIDELKESDFETTFGFSGLNKHGESGTVTVQIKQGKNTVTVKKCNF